MDFDDPKTLRDVDDYDFYRGVAFAILAILISVVAGLGFLGYWIFEKLTTG